jgi:hypothetical protein
MVNLIASPIRGNLSPPARVSPPEREETDMKIWHLLVALLIAYFAIWSANNVSAIGNVVGNS